MTNKITPERARDLLNMAHQGAVFEQRPVTIAANYAPLAEAAPALAELVAGLRYEYAAQVDHTRSDGTTWTKSSPWANTPEEAAAYSKQRKPDRIVRRLVSDPEVAE